METDLSVSRKSSFFEKECQPFVQPQDFFDDVSDLEYLSTE